MAATKIWSRADEHKPTSSGGAGRAIRDEDELVKRGGEWLIAKRRRVE